MGHREIKMPIRMSHIIQSIDVFDMLTNHIHFNVRKHYNLIGLTVMRGQGVGFTLMIGQDIKLTLRSGQERISQYKYRCHINIF